MSSIRVTPTLEESCQPVAVIGTSFVSGCRRRTRSVGKEGIENERSAIPNLVLREEPALFKPVLISRIPASHIAMTGVFLLSPILLTKNLALSSQCVKNIFSKLFFRALQSARGNGLMGKTGGETQRVIGRLESFDPTPGKSHAYVRIGNAKLHWPTSARGVLEGNVIRPCVNGERYEKILPETLIVADVTVNSEGANPFPFAWAPKHLPKSQRRR